MSRVSTQSASRDAMPSGTPKSDHFTSEVDRLKALLADQLERDALQQARETVIALLCLQPSDEDAVQVRRFLDEQLEMAATEPIGEVQCLTGHKGPINCVAWSPSGDQLASCSGGGTMMGNLAGADDRSVRIWDVESGREVRQLLGHGSSVNALAYNATGDYLLTGGRDGYLCLWDIAKGVMAKRIHLRGTSVTAVAFSPDGRSVFTASDDKVIRRWDLESGKRIRKYISHTRSITCLSVSLDGRALLSASGDQSIGYWDLDSGKLMKSLQGHKQGVLGVAFSPDNQQAVSGGADNSILIWDLATGHPSAHLSGHGHHVTSVAYAPDGSRILSGSADKTVRLWSVSTGKELRRFDGHSQGVQSVAFSPDGCHAVSGGRDAGVRIWHLPRVLITGSAVEQSEAIAEAVHVSVERLVSDLADSRILLAQQLEEVQRILQGRYKDARSLGLKLLERTWITTYQFNKLMQGNGRDLRMGDHILVDRLGEGGMGEVYKAKHLLSRRTVALKVVRGDLMSNADAVKQFGWEIQALAQMSHPNIIKTYGSYQANKVLFFTMEFIDGTDLSKLLQQSGPLPVPAACDYIRQAALGLEHAHEHCLIHRDIKPANLLLTVADDGSQGAVIKVLDWGLAGLRVPKHRRKAEHETPADEMVGTADYLAPEQAQDPANSDIRADIYSLGCSLYHLLSGKPPFPGGSLMQKLLHHQKSEPLPIQQLRPDIPEGLPAVLQKMMAKQAAQRYRSPAGVAAALVPFCKAP